MPIMAIPLPGQRRIRITVRGLGAIILAVAVYLGWIMNSASVQRDAVVALQTAGHDVYYDFQLQNGGIDFRAKPWCPTWLADFGGVDVFATVCLVIARGETSNTELGHIAKLSRLQHLSIRGNSATNAGIAQLKRLGDLERLSLRGTRITDAGLQHVGGLPRLQDLFLESPDISDAGIAHLKHATTLKSLCIADGRVTPVGARELRRALPGLVVFLKSDGQIKNLDDIP